MSAPFSAFDGEIRAIADVDAFGLVLAVPDGRAELFTRHRAGTAAHLMPLDRLPGPLRPATSSGDRREDVGPHVVTPIAERLDSENPITERLVNYGIESLFIAPIRNGAGLFWAGKHGADPFSEAQVRDLDALMRGLVEARAQPETAEARLRRLSKIDAAEQMLPVLAGALDVRDVFPRLSEVARAVLPHDAAGIQLLAEEDRSLVRFYALDGIESDVLGTFSTNYAAIFNEHFVYSIHDDLLKSPAERDRPSARAGMRSSLRVPLWFDNRIGGSLEFSSFEVGTYTESDYNVARRIGDFVSLAIVHQRMADDSRRAAGLRERSRNLQMLDGLLSTLADALDLREVFDRVSVIVHKVLPHDAMGVTTILEKEGRIRVHALSGFTGVPDSFEAPLPEPELLTEPWDYRIIDDMAGDPRYAASPTVKAGMRSVLGLPVRFDGRLVAGVNFYSRSKSAFGKDDVLVGRRIADHVALFLSHQRLAEEARVNAELKARADNVELLDDLLAAITDTADLRETFDRVSAMARKVIPHDALAVPVLLPDGLHARHYASAGLDVGPQSNIPKIIPVPPGFQRDTDWEYDLVEDTAASPEPSNQKVASLGFRSTLRVPIRLDGTLAAGIAFMAREPGVYRHADVAVARRIADRFARCLSRERRVDASRRADEANARASRLESRAQMLADELDARTGYRRVVGNSPGWRHVLTQATQVAGTETTVLLLGESGTGKEVVARFVHRASPRTEAPFVALNCAALPEQLLEAELFGFERGAFTGATQSKPGQLEQAAGGTLFLDEVGEMSLAAQAKFLRVLQEREFQRLGGTRVLRTDARVIAATNRNLQRAMEQGKFREDLFYRLNVFAIQLPPLRDRKADILPLSEAFLAEFGRTLGRPPAGISRDARERLLEYRWPGNVRELRNILERAAILCDGGLITAEHLALNPAPRPVPASEPEPAFAAVHASAESPAGDIASMERSMIESALQAARFNKSRAAKQLGLTRAQLYVRMKKYGLE